MVSINAIKARVKRNRLKELAGKFYRDEHSNIVKELNLRNKRAFLGIENDEGVYTIIGEKYIYYKTANTIESEIKHVDFLKFLSDNAMSKGKMSGFEFVNIDDQNVIWLLNAATMNAIWNTILLLKE